MARMHADELEIDDALVGRLLAEQFPEWAGLQLSRVEPEGTVNAIFRLGGDLSVRLARHDGPVEPGGKEIEWMPRLARLLPLDGRRRPRLRRDGRLEAAFACGA